MNEAEEEEANWIATRIPEIASELALTSDNTMQEEEKRREIIESIASALRFMHRDSLSSVWVGRWPIQRCRCRLHALHQLLFCPC
jgi:hypothetical protein